MDLKNLIDNLVKFEYSYGGYFGGYDKIIITAEKNEPITLTIYHSTKREPLVTREMSQDEFEAFKNKLYKSIKHWKLKYADNQIMDGTQWSLDLTSLDANTHYYGSNEYPINFKSFAKYMDNFKNVN